MKPHPIVAAATDCKDQPLLFPDLRRCQVAADFSGGTLATGGGALLPRPARELVVCLT